MENFKQNLYNPSNLEEYKEVNSEIPEELVQAIEGSLEIINSKFSKTIPLINKDGNIDFLIIEKDENGLSYKKYLIKIEKYK